MSRESLSEHCRQVHEARRKERDLALLEEVRKMPYFDLMLSELKNHRFRPRGPCGQASPSPCDYANTALSALLKLLEGDGE